MRKRISVTARRFKSPAMVLLDGSLPVDFVLAGTEAATDRPSILSRAADLEDFPEACHGLEIEE